MSNDVMTSIVVDRNHNQYHDFHLFQPAWKQQYPTWQKHEWPENTTRKQCLKVCLWAQNCFATAPRHHGTTAPRSTGCGGCGGCHADYNTDFIPRSMLVLILRYGWVYHVILQHEALPDWVNTQRCAVVCAATLQLLENHIWFGDGQVGLPAFPVIQRWKRVWSWCDTFRYGTLKRSNHINLYAPNVIHTM